MVRSSPDSLLMGLFSRMTDRCRMQIIGPGGSMIRSLIEDYKLLNMDIEETSTEGLVVLSSLRYGLFSSRKFLGHSCLAMSRSFIEGYQLFVVDIEEVTAQCLVVISAPYDNSSGGALLSHFHFHYSNVCRLGRHLALAGRSCP